MNKFIECQIIGEFKTKFTHDGVTYNFPDYRKFFGMYNNPGTYRINVDKIISANIESHAHVCLKDVERKCNFLMRLLGRKTKVKKCIALGEKVDVCRLVVEIGGTHETLYVNVSAYDLLTAMTEK